MHFFYGLLYLLSVHFIADFVLQTDWMAQNKSKDWLALTLHVGVYTTALQLAVIPLLWFSFPSEGLRVYAITNGILHFATDAITSRINSRLWADKKVHYFFVGVGADQLVHTWTLGLTMIWLLRG